jgi:hypothetical protein
MAAHGVRVDHQRAGFAGYNDALQEMLEVFLQHGEVGQVVTLVTGWGQRAG